jgi:hypothetical protein
MRTSPTFWWQASSLPLAQLRSQLLQARFFPIITLLAYCRSTGSGSPATTILRRTAVAIVRYLSGRAGWTDKIDERPERTLDEFIHTADRR